MHELTRRSTRFAPFAWASFHFGRDPYGALVVVYIFGPYYATEVIGDPVRGQELWGYINVFGAVVTALLAPVFGAIADQAGRRKPWIAAFVAMSVPAIAVLWFAQPGETGLSIELTAIALAVAGTAFSFSVVFHNAMLPTVAPAGRLGSVSGLGLAAGNVATVLLLVSMLCAFALPASGLFDWRWLPDEVLFGLDTATFEHNRIVAPVMAAWILVFSVPFLLFTPDGEPSGLRATAVVRKGFADLWHTIRRLRDYKNIAIYLLARMFYNDAVVALFLFGMIYASGLFGWGAGQRLIVGVAITVLAIAGSLIGGKIDDRIGSKRTLIVTIVGNALVLIVLLSITPETLFFLRFDGLDQPVWDFAYFQTLPELVYLLTSFLFAIFMPAAMTASRTMLARIAPQQEITKFYGLYALSGELTVFLGPLLVALFTGWFDSQRAGMASILILLAIGLVLLLFVRELDTSQSS